MACRVDTVEAAEDQYWQGEALSTAQAAVMTHWEPGLSCTTLTNTNTNNNTNTNYNTNNNYNTNTNTNTIYLLKSRGRL